MAHENPVPATSAQPPPAKNARHDRTPVIWLDPEKIKILDNHNVRYDMGDIMEFAETLLDPNDATRVKILEPLTVRKIGDYHFLEHGHRRHSGMMYLSKSRGIKLHAVPCNLLEGMDSDGERTFQQLIRNAGKDLSPIEKANAVAALLEEGYAEEDIRVRWGVSVVYMADLKKLYTAPKFLRDMIADGRLTPYLAITFTRHFPDHEKLEIVLKAADETAAEAAAKRGEQAYKIMPKHSEALLDLLPKSKKSKKKSDQMELIPTTATLRDALKSASKSKGLKIPEAQKEAQSIVLGVLDVLEGSISMEEFLKKMGVASKPSGEPAKTKSSKAKKSVAK